MLRAKVGQLHEQGLSGAEIGRRLGLSRSAVAYHLRRLGVPADARFVRRYDWAEVQAYYDAGHSITECQRRFGFARKTWEDARRRGDVRSRPQAMPVEQLLIGRRNRSHVKARLLRLGLKAPRCEACGIADWLGEPLSLCLHHVNGDRHDNRLENLRLLCPNCHSQTENFSGRNRRAAA